MRYYCYIILLFLSINTFSQGEANVWYFGENAGLDFNSGTPVPLNDGRLNTREGCSSFSDADGNLLFYIGAPNSTASNLTVWNRNHTPMPNGTGLEGNSSSSQSAMIIPRPGSTTQFYVFTVGANYGGDTTSFDYYTIDMTFDGGLGDVVGGANDLTQELLRTDWTEKVASVKGSECETYWVVSYVRPSSGQDEFFAYKVTSAGVASTPVRTRVSFPSNDIRGYLKISPDGKKLAIAHMNFNELVLYDFDNTTGIVSNQRQLQLSSSSDANQPYGLEFSPNSKKLYVHASNNFFSQNSSVNNNPANHHSALYQFDVSLNTLAEIQESKFLIDSRDLYRGALQLGPDRKIYRALSPTYDIGSDFLGVIENPDEDGSNVIYNHDAIDLGTGRSSQGLPPFIASIFSQIEITGEDESGTQSVINNLDVSLCTGDSFNIISETLTDVTSVTYQWLKNGIPYSTDQNLTFTNMTSLDNGNYKLEVEITDLCGNVSLGEGECTIEVYDIPTATQPNNIVQCDDDNDDRYEFDLKLQDSDILGSQTSIEYEVLYYNSESQAHDGGTPLPNPYPTGSTRIYARVQSNGNTDCYDITFFDIELYKSPMPNSSTDIEDLEECDDTLAGEINDGITTVDLTQKEDDILNGQSITDFELTYFTASDFAPTAEITDPTTFYNDLNPGGQTIYVQVINRLNDECSATTSFEFVVNNTPEILENFTFQNCDEDDDPNGYTVFDLYDVNEQVILNGATDITATYYYDYADANVSEYTGIGEIPNPDSFNNQDTTTPNTIYARYETLDNCYLVSTITLEVSTTDFPSDFEPLTIELCDDDFDGKQIFDLSQKDDEFKSSFVNPADLTVHYFRTKEDAEENDNEILPKETYENEQPFTQTLYVRMSSISNGGCQGIGPYLTLIVNEKPIVEVIEPQDIYCINGPDITLEVLNPDSSLTYIWSNDADGNDIIGGGNSIAISNAGEYFVTAVSNESCESNPTTVIVNPSIIATISENDVVIVDDSDNNTITIDTSNLGIGEYEFALDDNPFQNEPFFENVTPGIHLIKINDKNGCGESTPLEVAVIGFPRFFTPNNDGENDYWQVKGVSSDFFSSSIIYIFDRYGKLIANIDPTSEGWNGYYNGNMLPSTDYWFTAQLIDQNGNIRERKGHFSLIRRRY
ncbi:T9SS type B sorting domain-containing protein [Urechidicola croceus]|uniref:Ig-like domain-containing protein n=1 Tax=Urechidicola croceus TaxID=1850246 RepID=A0A1D8P3T6_9FLAO|nr:T9SS type B sorting domain-containing protein [Urechidicola croceus]AOW19243.1 hypothetical protein LPB138_00435 [Urechidicola croceus]